jgi:uncharacterized protein YegP (UPF0339 family)
MTNIELYKAKDGWRWRAFRGGRIVATSGEAYCERRKAMQSLDNLLSSIANGSVKLKEEKHA